MNKLAIFIILISFSFPLYATDLSVQQAEWMGEWFEKNKKRNMKLNRVFGYQRLSKEESMNKSQQATPMGQDESTKLRSVVEIFSVGRQARRPIRGQQRS